ncbi:hypothetical protein [Hymenobacter cavernae]|uniref:hypothetical protein n=1 Tax=Hymenobacter cavernae TaxID=2044852 RepID=UPI0016661C8A|nr:hypothetical protein [Hymenobacter cavernae]
MFFLAGSCKKDQDPTLETSLFGIDWDRASTQPDAEGNYTYKPRGTFTSSGWGRDGFRLESDGTFVWYTSGLADGALDISGTWTSEDNQGFRLKPNDTGIPEFILVTKPVQNNMVQARYIFRLY